MPAWLLRGIGMGVLHALAVTAVAQVTVYNPTGLEVTKAVMLALLVGVAALWSALDGWLRRADRGRNWFVAALIAGPLSGILSVIGRAAFVDQTGINALGEALTGGAAFVALLVLVPAGLGLFVGSRLLSPRQKASGDAGDADSGSGSASGGKDTPAGAKQAPRRPSPSPRPRS